MIEQFLQERAMCTNICGIFLSLGKRMNRGCSDHPKSALDDFAQHLGQLTSGSSPGWNPIIKTSAPVKFSDSYRRHSSEASCRSTEDVFRECIKGTGHDRTIWSHLMSRSTKS